MAASKEPTTPDDLTSTVNPRVLNDTLLTNAKPLQINPHFQSGTTDDDYTRAHINADTDSGDGAIHHTLGHLGGAATYDHDHGTYTSQALPLRGSGTLNLGAGGISTITWQKIAKKLMYIRMFSYWSGAGRAIGNFWRYDWTADFNFKDKIRPAGAAVLDATFVQGGFYVYTGKLLWDGSNSWSYYWKLDDASAPVGTIGGLTNDGSPFASDEGSFVYATGIYEFKDVS